MQIGIIGGGFVGKATHNSLKNHYVGIYDPKFKNFSDFAVIEETDACFICVPTPTEEGRQDPKIVLDTIQRLFKINYSGLIIIKSTLLPKYMEDVLVLYPNLNIMAAPEFLDQATYLKPQEKHLIGVTTMFQVNIYKKIFPEATLVITDPTTAFTSKYTHNVHAGVKVTLFNEIFDLCNRIGVNYREMIRCMLEMNDNVGPQYTRIAVDGQRGYGGACIPKDIVAFYTQYGITSLNAAIHKNIEYRTKEMEKVL
jgi:nucleotide sugar dehydrogenase